MSAESAVGTASHDRPDAPGWSSAATAIHSIRQLPGAMLLVLDAVDFPSIVIDFRHNAYDWGVPLRHFPVAPQSVAIQTHMVQPTDPLLFDLPGRNLDALLWMIGLNSFDGAPAWWLDADGRHRLTRWPNLTELVHTPEQLRMIAMLGNAGFSVADLAAGGGVTVEEAQRLLNALSLMGILRTSAEPRVAVPVAKPHHRGLFRRLIDRLGARG